MCIIRLKAHNAEKTFRIIARLEHFSKKVLAMKLKYVKLESMVAITKEIKKVAHDKVSHAIFKGRLVCPGVCSNCGEPKTRKNGASGIAAHHPDYSRPLEVEWLCDKCHGIEHQTINWVGGFTKPDQILVKGKSCRLPVLKDSPAITCGHLTERYIVDEHKYFEDEDIDWDKYLDQLTYREREVIKLRYGFEDGYTYTLEEIARIFRVTRERVRQIETKAIMRLRMRVVAEVA